MTTQANKLRIPRRLKPTMYKQTRRVGFEWVCAGTGCGGAGDTPAEAYERWMGAMYHSYKEGEMLNYVNNVRHLFSQYLIERNRRAK